MVSMFEISGESWFLQLLNHWCCCILCVVMGAFYVLHLTKSWGKFMNSSTSKTIVLLNMFCGHQFRDLSVILSEVMYFQEAFHLCCYISRVWTAKERTRKQSRPTKSKSHASLFCGTLWTYVRYLFCNFVPHSKVFPHCLRTLLSQWLGWLCQLWCHYYVALFCHMYC